MKSKIKQLLVGVLTVAVISSNFAAALIPGAATITGTIAVTENKTVVASTTDTTVDVPVKVTFTEPVTGPHGRFSITADGATLTDIKVDSFDNANAKENPDAYVRIGDEYGDDGTNLETGTILVESAIDNKAAVVTYINLVTTFTVPANTAADTVIPVTVKGIDATNANEDNWEDLVATDGNITVTAAEPDYGTLTNGSADLLYKNNMDLPVQYQNTVYSGDIADIEEYGIIVIREDKYDGGALTTETPGAMSQTWDTLQTNSNLSVYGFAFKNITKEYIFVNYVKVNGKYIYADSVRTSYATLCANRIPTGGTGGEKATLYLDTYYTLFGEKLYDGAKELDAADTNYGYDATYTKNEHTFPTMGTDLTYTIANTNGYLLFNNMEFGYGLTLSYNGDTSKVLETGVLMLREDKYTEGTQITKDTAGVLCASGEGFVEAAAYSVYGFSMSNIIKDYIFVPYVETADGVVYGEYLSRSFADTILARLDASGSNKAKAIFDVYAAANSSASLYQKVEK